LAELEKEAYKLVLFIEEPKFYSTQFPYTVNDRDPYPYKDPTKLDKILRLRELKEKIDSVKKKLGISISEKLEFYVNVKNNTFPRHSDDLLNHYNQSYSQNFNTFPKKRNLLFNANSSRVDDVYNLRKLHLYPKNYKFTNQDITHEKAMNYNDNLLEQEKKKIINFNKIDNVTSTYSENSIRHLIKNPQITNQTKDHPFRLEGTFNKNNDLKDMKLDKPKENSNYINHKNNKKFLEDFSLDMDNEILQYFKKIKNSKLNSSQKQSNIIKIFQLI